MNVHIENQSAPLRLLLTYKQAASAMGVSLSTVRKMVDAGDLIAIRPGPMIVRIPLTEIQAWIERKVTEARQMPEASPAA